MWLIFLKKFPGCFSFAYLRSHLYVVPAKSERIEVGWVKSDNKTLISSFCIRCRYLSLYEIYFEYELNYILFIVCKPYRPTEGIQN